MGRCAWVGVMCNCGQGFPFTENGVIPKRCEDRMPLPLVVNHQHRVRPEKLAEYKAWVKAGQPKLSEWTGVPDEPEDEPRID